MKRSSLLVSLLTSLLLSSPVWAQPIQPNNFRCRGAALGSSPTCVTEGLDTNISLIETMKGTGGITVNAPGGHDVVQGTLTADSPARSDTATWNNAAATFNGWQLNVTDTNSAAASLLLNLQRNGSTVFSVDKLGAVTPAARSDITMFYSAVTFCRSDTATIQNGLIPVRLASADWAIARTAAGAETLNIICDLPIPTRTLAGKGWRIDSFRIAQQITVVNLTSNTFNKLATVTYANNVANAVADYGGVITIVQPTVTQANPYLTAATVGTPAFMNTSNAKILMDWTAVLANTGVYRVYGISVTWTQQD